MELIFSLRSLWVLISSQPGQQDDAVEWLLPLLPWHQCVLPLRHHSGCHCLHLPLPVGHFHHHPPGDPGQEGKWRELSLLVPALCIPHSSFPASKTGLESKHAHRFMTRTLGPLVSRGDELQPNPACTPMLETPNSTNPDLQGVQQSHGVTPQRRDRPLSHQLAFLNDMLGAEVPMEKSD